MKSTTIYFDDAQGLAHELHADVNPDTGEHKITYSVVYSFDGSKEFAYAQAVRRFGIANVRAYTVKEYTP